MVENNLLENKAIDNLCGSIESANPQLIDFDILLKTLRESGQVSKEYRQLKKDLEILKKDYKGRIIGMLKAGLACRRNEDDLELAARMTGDAGQFSAEELVKIYERTAAKFRTRFPASFKYLSYQAGSQRRDWKEHKI
jgi:hypothetical protein